MTGKYIKRKLNNAGKWIKQRPYYIRRAWTRKRIKNRDFTIISNNCWAGRCYQYLGMPYLSPTVGLYFFAEDYLKFVSDLRYYLSLDLEFISAERSRYFEILKERDHIKVPVGKLDDLEIVFLHYKSESEAREKWNRRKRRINYNNIYLKFSKMNLCTEDELSRFDALRFENKFMFNNQKTKKYSCEYFWDGPVNEQEILTDTLNFPGNIPLITLLNREKEGYPEQGLIIEE